MNKNKYKFKIGVALALAILIFFMFLQIFPFYLSLVQSLQPSTFKPTSGIKLFPQSLSFINYAIAWKDSNLIMGFVWSIIYAGSFTAVTAVLVTLVAFILSKKKFKGRNFVFLFFMSALMVPGEILLVSNYILIIEIGLYKSPLAVILPGLVNVFGIFLLKQFMHTIPDSVLESATIDGANTLNVFFRIVLPMAMPAIATYSIITFIGQWNEYLWPQLVLNSVSPFDPIQIKLLLYRPMVDGSLNHPYAFTLKIAATMITLIPVLVVYFIFQKFFTEGISVTGMK